MKRNIIRLEIAMHESLVMNVREPFHHVRGDAQRVLRRQRQTIGCQDIGQLLQRACTGSVTKC